MTEFLPLDMPAIASPGASGRRRETPHGAGQSDFEKDPLGRYDTIDPRAVRRLLPHLQPGTRFIEPCAGKGDLVRQLVAAGHDCVDQFDIAPRAPGIRQQDALTWQINNYDLLPAIITNPPFDWELLQPLLENWRDQVTFTWVLLPATFMHRDYAGPVLRRCRKIVTIGQLKWAVDTKDSSVQIYCWYLFGRTSSPGNTPLFHYRGWQRPAD